MNALFGIPMDSIMRWSLGLFLITAAMVAVLALRHRLLFALGMRNIPRRRAQTILIVVGLMLGTVIITSAFATGDTLSYTVRHIAVSQLGTVDEIVTGRAAAENAPAPFMPQSIAARIRNSLPSSLADGVTGALSASASVQDSTSRQTKANVEILGLPSTYPQQAFGSLTATDGAAVRLAGLRAGEVYLNETAAQALDAHAGDRLHVYAGGRPISLQVKAILKSENLAAGMSGRSSSVAVVLLPLDHIQAIIGRPGQINAVYISNRGDALSGADLSDRVVAALRAPLANPVQVAAAQRVLATSQGRAALQKLQHNRTLSAQTRSKLHQLQQHLGDAAGSTTLTSLLDDGDVIAALKTIDDPAIASGLSTPLALIRDYTVQEAKTQALQGADQAGSEISTVFLVFGLFSITAGIMLIFLIFVMLAAERRTEMGMARAVGTKRRHLIEQFLFEGYAYDLGAALIGIVVGTGVGLTITSVIGTVFSTFGLTIYPHVTARSIVVSFCSGALVTFLTVVVSSWRVSRLNIVSAIRDIPDDLRVDGSIAAAFVRPIRDLQTGSRLLRRGRPVGAFKALLAAPWHGITAFRVFISRGPILLLAGVLLLQLGMADKQLFPFNLGISLLLVGAAMMLRWGLGIVGLSDRPRNRIGFTLAGLSLVVFWLLPFDALRSDLHWDIEMFFLSGVMLVLGGVWTVMYNSDLVLGGLLLVLGRARALAPVLKTAVSYPMQHRFRTGLTLAMFSLVMFTLIVMSVLTGSLGGETMQINRDFGGYDIYGTTAALNPINDVAARVASSPQLHSRITAAGSTGTLMALLHQSGQDARSWDMARINVADDSYLASTRFVLHGRAAGYRGDAQVWQALRTHPGYTVISGYMVKHKTNNNVHGFQLQSISYEDRSFKPATIDMRDPQTGQIVRLTVIGVIDDTSFSADGLYTGERTLAAGHIPPVAPDTYFFRVKPGQDVHQTARLLGAAFLPNGLDVTESSVAYNQSMAINLGINNMLTGFMALGLVVGIAALGVIASRSVVERRQHIGVLRAIGFKRRMIQASFLLESSFVSLVGIGLGTILGIGLAAQLVAHFAKTDANLHLIVPWPEIGGIVVLAYAASLLTTYLPARQAARIYPAEALRYE